MSDIDVYTSRTRLRSFALWADRRAAELVRGAGKPSIATPEELRAFAAECRSRAAALG